MTLNASGHAPWWADAVFYQVYPRSFADGNGDGSGDLIGLRERLDHLVELGIDALWISPFFCSPMADNGYDVSDPCDVDPMFGTLADFDALLADAHARGIKVTIDVVPNHFSDQHPWFQAALAAAPGSPERARFIFRPGRGSDGELPPNNWPSAFGGPAWARVPDGEWYLHLFAPEQPDLDWTNPEVPAEFERIFRFWLDRGVDGFRIDVGQGMAKPDELADMDLAVLAPRRARQRAPALAGRSALGPAAGARLPPGFRRVLDSYPGERMAVGEVWVADDERLARYVRPDELNLAFNFELAVAPLDAAEFRKAIESSIQAHGTRRRAVHLGAREPRRRPAGHPLRRRRCRAWRAHARLRWCCCRCPARPTSTTARSSGWATSTCPTTRCATRPGSAAGTPCAAATVSGCRCHGRAPTPPFGFSTADSTWLPMPAAWAGLGVLEQAADPSSTLRLYRDALRLRRTVFAPGGDVEWLDAPVGVLAYRRGDVTVLVNTGSEPALLPQGAVLLASGPLGDDGTVPVDTAVWVR